MSIIETLVTTVGLSVAKATLKLWFADQEIANATAGSLLDLVSKKLPGYLERKKINRTFEKIIDLSAENIQKLLEKESGELAPHRLKQISKAAATTLDSTPIDIDFLVKKNLNEEQLLKYFLEKTGAEGGNPALAGHPTEFAEFTEQEQQLYQSILSRASQLIVELSTNIPQFDLSVSKELLERTDSMAQKVIDGINRITEDQKDSFETKYRSACINKWDKLQLFGVDLNETNKRYQLSVAYVTLMVDELSNSAEESIDENLEDRESLAADQALLRHPRLVIRGPAGAGKTTLLQWYAVHSAARQLTGELEPLNDSIPFLIQLRHFVDATLPTPEEFPVQAAKNHVGTMPQGWVHEKLESGHAIILIDGLDEVSEARREEVKDWLRELTEAFDSCRFVVTMRPHAAIEGWLDDLNYVDAELQEMTRPDIEEFIDHWHCAVSTTVQSADDVDAITGFAVELKNKLLSEPTLTRLASSPLLCAMLCALNRERFQTLPGDRIELYKACIEMLFRRDDERKVQKEDYLPLDTRHKESLIQQLAWWMIKNGKTSVSPKEVEERFAAHYARMKNVPEEGTGAGVLKLFLERVGLLQESSQEEIDFPHRTFQEFLAAKEAVSEQEFGLLADNAQKVQWREVVVLGVGLCSAKNAANMILEILKRGDDDEELRHTLYLVAVSALELLVADTEENDLDIEQEVKNRLEQILPPRTVGEAKQLATAGEHVLPFLEYNPKLKGREAIACIRTLALIGTPAAFELLQSYSASHVMGVQKELAVLFLTDQVPPEYAQDSLKNVTDLNLSNRKIMNLGPLIHCPKLETLDLNGTQVSDITPLAECNNLEGLNLSGTQVSNISSLAKCNNLQILGLSATQVSDITPLAECNNLEGLNLSGTQVSDITPLAECNNLEGLNLSGTQVSDITPLAECNNLEWLNLSGTQVSDISSLAKCNNLSWLNLSGTQVSDISSLAKCNNLTWLYLNGTQVCDISPLAKCNNLNRLNLNDTQVSDISPLAKCNNLLELGLSDTQVSDISPLQKCPMIHSLSLHNVDLEDWSTLIEMKSLNHLYANRLDSDFTDKLKGRGVNIIVDLFTLA